jgi:hypothetical protein
MNMIMQERLWKGEVADGHTVLVRENMDGADTVAYGLEVPWETIWRKLLEF